MNYEILSIVGFSVLSIGFIGIMTWEYWAPLLGKIIPFIGNDAVKRY